MTGGFLTRRRRKPAGGMKNRVGGGENEARSHGGTEPRRGGTKRQRDRGTKCVGYDIDMHPPSRARRILKWTGAIACLLILVTWAASLRWGFRYHFSNGYRCVGVSTGALEISRWTCTYPKFIMAWGSPQNRYLRARTPIGLEIHRPSFQYITYRNFGFESPHKELSNPPSGTLTSVWWTIPFWLVLLLTAIPTAWLWHRDRRLISSSPDHRLCLRCGYDLTGNTSGVCPECGDKACPPAGLADSECAQAKPPPAPV